MWNLRIYYFIIEFLFQMENMIVALKQKNMRGNILCSIGSFLGYHLPFFVDLSGSLSKELGKFKRNVRIG